MRRQVIDWKKIFTNDTLDKGLLSKICEEHSKLNNKNANNPVIKGPKI